jgi:hypothetical protein
MLLGGNVTYIGGQGFPKILETAFLIFLIDQTELISGSFRSGGIQYARWITMVEDAVLGLHGGLNWFNQ